MSRRAIAGALGLSLGLPVWLSGIDLGPPAARAEEPTSGTAPDAQTVLDCLERNRPARAARQHLTFTCIDRLGQRSPTEAELLGKRLDAGARKGLSAVRLDFTAPYELRGSRFLINEAQGRSNDMFFYSSATRIVRRITGRATTGNVFCTDFSYEDFERWQLLNRPGASRRLPDAELDGRKTHVIETRPAKDAGSAYERVVTTVDQQTCVALRSESYEPGSGLRKVLAAEASSLVQSGPMWLATRIEMRDVREDTYTEVSIRDVEIDVDISDRTFAHSELGK